MDLVHVSLLALLWSMFVIWIMISLFTKQQGLNMFHMHALITKEKYSKKNLYYLQFIWHSLLGQNMFGIPRP
jgi:hypothetical protein